MNPYIIEIINAFHGVDWSLVIPQYFFFTGISAAAFLISAMTYVFGDEHYRPIAKLSLIVAFTVLVAAPLNLIADLGQQGRFYSLFYHTHATSPMSWGSFLLTTYPLLIALEGVFAFRAGFARKAQKSSGGKQKLYKFLALGNQRVTPETEKRDHKWSYILGAIGIPFAIAVHGYTGYILGVVRARPLWHTPLMPITFLVSAMVSGIAFMLILAWLMVRNDEGRINWPLIDRLAVLLGWTIVTDLTIRLFWYSIGFFYSYGSYQDVIHFMFKEHFTETVLIEIVLSLTIPAIVMLIPALRRIRPLLILSALVTIAGVWLFRWDTVIGGQEIPKTAAGFYHYLPEFWGSKGVMEVISNWAFWIFIFILFTWFLPWRSNDEGEVEDESESEASDAQEQAAILPEGGVQ
jgi:tetrathionate reductase subunit C